MVLKLAKELAAWQVVQIYLSKLDGAFPEELGQLFVGTSAWKSVEMCPVQTFALGSGGELRGQREYASAVLLEQKGEADEQKAAIKAAGHGGDVELSL